jgi:non-heme chloroperoxidase
VSVIWLPPVGVTICGSIWAPQVMSQPFGFIGGNANLNPWTEAKVNTKNPDRGPLLIIDGERDHTVPWAIANAAYKRQSRSQVVTEIVKIPNRGHSLTIDHGWREVAQTALDFVKRFVPAKPG